MRLSLAVCLRPQVTDALSFTSTISSLSSPPPNALNTQQPKRRWEYLAVIPMRHVRPASSPPPPPPQSIIAILHPHGTSSPSPQTSHQILDAICSQLLISVVLILREALKIFLIPVFSLDYFLKRIQMHIQRPDKHLIRHLINLLLRLKMCETLKMILMAVACEINIANINQKVIFFINYEVLW